MWAESVWWECLEVNMTDIYELWNEGQWNFEAEYIWELLQKWFNIEFGTKDVKWKDTWRYHFVTYVNWEKVTFDMLGSTWDALKNVFKDNENYLLNISVSSRIHNMFDSKSSRELNEIIENFWWDETLAFYLVSIYSRNILFEKWRVLPEYLEDWNYDLDFEIAKALDWENKLGMPQIDREQLYWIFENLWLKEFIDEAIRLEWVNFDQRRQEYLSIHREEWKREICDYVWQELAWLNWEFQLEEIEYTDNWESLSELLKFLNTNWFKKHPRDNIYISWNREVHVHFSEKNLGLITVEKSPSWKHITDANTFMKDYSKNWYKKYNF